MDLFYQKHSDTSREAAENNTSAGAQREQVYEFIYTRHGQGATADEVRQYLLQRKLIHPNSVIGARVRELELKGRIVKTKTKRKTIAGRQANVYVTKEIFSMGGYERDTVKDSTDYEKLRQENERMREALLAITREEVTYLQGLTVFTNGVDAIFSHTKKGLSNG